MDIHYRIERSSHQQVWNSRQRKLSSNGSDDDKVWIWPGSTWPEAGTDVFIAHTSMGWSWISLQEYGAKGWEGIAESIRLKDNLI